VAKVRFASSSESLEWNEPVLRSRTSGRVVSHLEVASEARQRKAALGLDEWQLREFITGAPVPANIRQACREIDLAADCLGRMSPIPTNFDDDVYWPRVW
jgi:hypothetical protein